MSLSRLVPGSSSWRPNTMNMIAHGAVVAVCLCVFGMASAQVGTDSAARFSELMEADWKGVFSDPCTRDWKANWTLDGLQARVENSEAGMSFAAGSEAFNDAHHAVLWTKQDFKGDLKIEYEYTRLDSEIKMVTILYIQATGTGEPGFGKDIAAWSDKRRVPAMRTYFNNMNAYHISYAAFHTKNEIPGNDYVRSRRYLGGGLAGTELDNEYEKTGLFGPGVPHKITVIKHGRDIYMQVQNAQKEMLFHFINSRFPLVAEGKIGLRHMYTRAARYKDFKVSVLAEGERGL